VKEHRGTILLGTLSTLVVVVIAFTLAYQVSLDDAFAERVVAFGPISIVLLAYVSGLDLIVPMPAVAFVPVFTAAHFSLPLIVSLMVIGTVLADLTAYVLGYYGRRVRTITEARVYERLQQLVHTRSHLVLPALFLYAAIVPLPNELLVIPLALLGYRLTTLLIPLIAGTIIHISLFAYGIDGLFDAVTTGFLG
jgi:membrane protein YqaA with SNARE-associated domain